MADDDDDDDDDDDETIEIDPDNSGVYVVEGTARSPDGEEKPMKGVMVSGEMSLVQRYMAFETMAKNVCTAREAAAIAEVMMIRAAAAAAEFDIDKAVEVLAEVNILASELHKQLGFDKTAAVSAETITGTSASNRERVTQLFQALDLLKKGEKLPDDVPPHIRELVARMLKVSGGGKMKTH